MSWKNGDKGFLPVELISLIPSSVDDGVGRFVAIGCGVRYDIPLYHVCRSIPPSSPAPVDVSQIKVGDEVTVKAIVKTVSCRTFEHPFELKVIGGDDADLDLVWVDESAFVSHTPSRPPSTLAEFKAMTNEQQERWFGEMVKGKVT